MTQDEDTNENRLVSGFKINFVDFCHDSAKQVNLMALAAPKVQVSRWNDNENYQELEN